MEIELNDDLKVNKSQCSALTSISVIKEEMPYSDFFVNYLLSNTPCIIKNVTLNWESTEKWLTHNNKPDFEYLKMKYGKCDVTVYNCQEKYFNSHKTEHIKLESYLDYWESTDLTELKYLKDWHLKNTFKDDYFYTVPIYFASDWLNEYFLDNCNDDYRFVYMGPKGTWTPFHADVFNSFSWSTNICGAKKWVLLYPNEESKLRDKFYNLPYDISEINNCKHITLIQEAGEAIFVPSGWYHQVWNLDDTISINHNWVNAANIKKMWLSLQENLNLVKKEIRDCQGMEDFLGHCQIVLNASYGLDFYKFYDFLAFIARKRIEVLECGELVLFNGFKLGRRHAIFDLKAVKVVLETFLEHEDFMDLEYFRSLDSTPNDLMKQIKQF